MTPVAPTRRTVLGAAAGMGALPMSPSSGRTAQVPPEAGRGTTLTINGNHLPLDLEPSTSLLDALREQTDLTGTKKGCDHGSCGACTVHINGQRVLACLTLAMRCEGKTIRTIEGLADGEALHPVQAAFLEHDGMQCGYCTPGQIMSAVALIEEGHAGSDDEIREWMSGNICRCGAYPNILAAVRDAASGKRG